MAVTAHFTLQGYGCQARAPGGRQRRGAAPRGALGACGGGGARGLALRHAGCGCKGPCERVHGRTVRCSNSWHCAVPAKFSAAKDRASVCRGALSGVQQQLALRSPSESVLLPASCEGPRKRVHGRTVRGGNQLALRSLGELLCCQRVDNPCWSSMLLLATLKPSRTGVSLRLDSLTWSSADTELPQVANRAGVRRLRGAGLPGAARGGSQHRRRPGAAPGGGGRRGGGARLGRRRGAGAERRPRERRVLCRRCTAPALVLITLP